MDDSVESNITEWEWFIFNTAHWFDRDYDART